MNVEEYKKQFAPSEETEQIHLMTWCRWAESKFPKLEAIYHVPNEGKRSAAEGGRLKEAGLKPGVPDICLPVPRGEYSGLYIELKRIGGKPTMEQIEWLEILSRYGNAVALCAGAEAAEEVITAYCNRDSDALDGLLLSSDRGDFDRLRERIMPKKKRKPKVKAVVLQYIAIAAAQIILTVADVLMNGTITGRSFLIALPLIISATVKEVKEMYCVGE